MNSCKLLRKSAVNNVSNEREYTKSRNENFSTYCKSTFSDVLQTQNSNSNILDDFLMVRSANFKNENEYKKHLITKSRDSRVNNIMNHPVDLCGRML